jgi:hypothetical protein
MKWAEEARGKGVEGAAHLQQVGFRHRRQPEALAAHLDALVQVGKLRRRDLHRRALEVGHQRRLRKAVADEKQQPIHQRHAHRADHQRRPDQQRHSQHDAEQRLSFL